MACVFPTDQVIVVGGGLAGVSAGNTALERGCRVVLLDKSSFCGGNSTKATSGINGAGTRTQKNKGITDSSELFTADTLKGGAKRPEVVKVLCCNSGTDVEWLMDKFDLDLSLVARLGGHSAPRTHRGQERFPGMTITYALIQMLEKVAERTDLVRIVTKARVVQLLMNEKGACVGVVYEKSGVELQEHGPVILASGGFGADFSSDGFLARYRPDLLHLPTTNGEHCSGDGIRMGEAIGGKSIDLEWVQVHPTGLVKTDDPDAKIKFLAAEALRGVGGLVLNADGDRFANELGRRDYVTGEMWKSKPPFRLALNKAAADEIHWHCKHYVGRGVMKYYETGADLAKDMGIPVQKLVDVHNAHYEAAQKTEKDPDGGPWPAYPSGKSWDESSGKTGSGKKFYHNVLPGSAVPSEPFHVAIITPVIHYCMGGLEIDTASRVLNSSGSPIPGLYAAGEVAGGVHGNNRLGGNSLLDCVVFGRVAAADCADYILGAGAGEQRDLKALASLPPKAGPAKPAETSGASAKAAAPAAPAAPLGDGKPPVKPGWQATYNAESWEKKKHARKWFVRLYRRYEAWANSPTLYERFETRMGWDVEAPGPLLSYEPREPTVVNMQYFPLPDEKGANALIPGFRTNKSTCTILGEFVTDCWGGISESGKTKLYFVLILLFLYLVVVYIVHMEIPHEPL